MSQEAAVDAAIARANQLRWNRLERLPKYYTEITTMCAGQLAQIEIEVIYTWHESLKGSWELGGQQLEPDEPAFAEIECVRESDSGAIVTWLSERQIQALDYAIRQRLNQEKCDPDD
jgi:hypothetical protein